MDDNKVLWFLIYLIITCTFIWLIGFFISLNMLWFYDSMIGRIIALILFGVAIRSSAELVDTF
jgi:hypothetical protein